MEKIVPKILYEIAAQYAAPLDRTDLSRGSRSRKDPLLSFHMRGDNRYTQRSKR